VHGLEHLLDFRERLAGILGGDTPQLDFDDGAEDEKLGALFPVALAGGEQRQANEQYGRKDTEPRLFTLAPAQLTDIIGDDGPYPLSCILCRPNSFRRCSRNSRPTSWRGGGSCQKRRTG